MSKQEILDWLSTYSGILYNLNLRQAASDYDYLIAYLNSVNLNNYLKDAENLWPHPAGKDTIDAYSHNCPIPYESLSIYYNLVGDGSLAYYFKAVYNLLVELLTLSSNDNETIAIQSFIDYTKDILIVLGFTVDLYIDNDEMFFIGSASPILTKYLDNDEMFFTL
jgi:hypothetical protein